MNAHTPGPWMVNTTKLDGAIVRWHIASAKHGSTYPICEHILEGEPDGSEQLANAHLLAAAPDILAALRYWFDAKATPGELARMAGAAIAKAEGRPS
jgi:hypothetical protein